LIVLTNTNTGVKITTQSTATGTYVFDDVLPGRYTVEVQAAGFEKYVVNDVLIHVQQVMTVDAHLATGSVQESVSVTAATPLLQAESAQVGQSIGNQAVNDNFIPVGGNGTSATYYMSNKGCQVGRAAIFNTVAVASNINIDCVSGLALGNDQKDNFAPRVGFAYRVRPTLVVRGGFGTAYGALGNHGYGGTLGTNYPFVYTQGIPAPDSNHPLLIGNPQQPATMEYTFTHFNFQNPTVLQRRGGPERLPEVSVILAVQTFACAGRNECRCRNQSSFLTPYR
jgi:hypothetical protein